MPVVGRGGKEVNPKRFVEMLLFFLVGGGIFPIFVT